MTTPPSPGRITAWLQRAPRSVFTIYAMTAAFTTYFAMYAFRKPFAAATFEGMTFLGTEVALKTAFVISQIMGYTLSKYIGIKLCSELVRSRRALWLAGLIVAAELALLLFAVLPPDAKVVAIFANGLPLGMIWGLVVSYLEGRRTSELLLAGLSCSFILSSGIVKDVGITVMESYAVSESWMPFVTGGLFLPVFFIAVWLLNQIPAPDEGDMAERAERAPMDGRARRSFVREFLPGLIALLAVYFLLTAFRDFRDNYGIDIFNDLGYGDSPAIFTRTELPVAFGVMLAMATLNLIKNNKWGLFGAYVIMISGLATLGIGTLMFDAGTIDGVTWMILTGLGSYLAYVPYNSVLFDRMIAYTRVAGTAVFTIYLADAIGYTGSVGLQLYRDLAFGEATRMSFFRSICYVMSVGGIVVLAYSLFFFMRWRPSEAAKRASGAVAPSA